MRTFSVLIIALASAMLGGCIHPPGVQTIAEPDRSGYINPEKFRVVDGAYPMYAAVSKLERPPSTSRVQYRMVAIEPTDAWKVTHRIGDRLVLYSEAYQQRQCRYVTDFVKAVGGTAGGGRIDSDGNCYGAPFLYSLIIDRAGEVNGWKFVPNPERNRFAADREMKPDPEQGTTDGWPAHFFTAK